MASLRINGEKYFTISHEACSNPYMKNTIVLVLSLFLSFYSSLEMNYPAQLEFYNFDDVYVTSRDINFAIVQLFGTSLGQ